jgi:hypothetical protein
MYDFMFGFASGFTLTTMMLRDEDKLFPIKDEGWPWRDDWTFVDQINHMKDHYHKYHEILDQLKDKEEEQK